MARDPGASLPPNQGALVAPMASMVRPRTFERRAPRAKTGAFLSSLESALASSVSGTVPGSGAGLLPMPKNAMGLVRRRS
jgi:hypothetical protein